jgi:2-polyprenyl-3-methyl-5-hydroxy-6-metoxy-1,4-benzoquinol methylase
MNERFYNEYVKRYKHEEQFKSDFPLSNEKRVKDFWPFLDSPILDVGCSRGHDTNFFAKHGFLIEGCDISAKAVQIAKKNYPKLNFFVCDFENQKVNKKFNTLLCLDIIDHVFDCNKFLQNAWECLNDKGKIILTCPNVLGLKNRMKFLFGDSKYFFYGHFAHIRFFGVNSLKQLLEENGFQVLKVFGYSRLPLPVSLCGSLTFIAEKKTK